MAEGNGLVAYRDQEKGESVWIDSDGIVYKATARSATLKVAESWRKGDSLTLRPDLSVAKNSPEEGAAVITGLRLEAYGAATKGQAVCVGRDGRVWNESTFGDRETLLRAGEDWRTGDALLLRTDGTIVRTAERTDEPEDGGPEAGDDGPDDVEELAIDPAHAWSKFAKLFCCHDAKAGDMLHSTAAGVIFNGKCHRLFPSDTGPLPAGEDIAKGEALCVATDGKLYRSAFLRAIGGPVAQNEGDGWPTFDPKHLLNVKFPNAWCYEPMAPGDPARCNLGGVLYHPARNNLVASNVGLCPVGESLRTYDKVAAATDGKVYRKSSLQGLPVAPKEGDGGASRAIVEEKTKVASVGGTTGPFVWSKDAGGILQQLTAPLAVFGAAQPAPKQTAGEDGRPEYDRKSLLNLEIPNLWCQQALAAGASVREGNGSLYDPLTYGDLVRWNTGPYRIGEDVKKYDAVAMATDGKIYRQSAMRNVPAAPKEPAKLSRAELAVVEMARCAEIARLEKARKVASRLTTDNDVEAAISEMMGFYETMQPADLAKLKPFRDALELMREIYK